MESIFIKDLILPCRIGVTEEERQKKQNICFNITIFADLRLACKTDQLENTVNYRSLAEKIEKTVENSEHHLLEALASRVAEICLEDPRVLKVKISAEKPSGIAQAKSVGIEIIVER